jgi:membrane complex biogenesis BtpA family protein
MTTTGQAIAPRRPDPLRTLFGHRRVAIGVVHCRALPGSPAYAGASVDDICDQALADAVAYAAGGVHGLIVENHGDIPFSKPEDIGQETAAVMAVIADRVRREVDLPVGINVLANAAMTALAVAKAAGASFVRVNEWANAYVANEGLIEGPAAAATRYRSWLHAQGVAVFADVHVKHGAHAIVADRSIAELTRDVEFFDADAVIVTGQRTGDAAVTSELEEVREATSLPVLIGSGVTRENVGSLMDIADGVIIGSSLKQGGVWWGPVEAKRVEDFMRSFG